MMKKIQRLILLTLTLLPGISWSQTCDPDAIYAVEDANAVCTEIENNVRMFYSNNYPDHGDTYNSPFTIAAGDYEYSMCAYPEQATSFTPLYEETETTKGCTYTYTFGVGLNGVKYDPSSAEYFENTSTGENNIEWHIEARYIFSPNFGNNGGHLNPFGEYHYHDIPADYFTNDLSIDGSEHSPIVGYAADGFPIYYKYVYSDATDSTSSITALSSGYSLKSGTRPGDGVSAPDGSYNGLYYEDYEYATSELDECNGRYGVTPDYPYGTYYYVLTDNYPYIPRCFKGTAVDNTFRVGPDAACPASTASTDCSMPVYGCMDPFSNNYDPDANVDDGSCTYDECTLAATISSTKITSSGANDGTAAVTVSGAQGNITYTWSNGASSSSVSNLAEGTYTVTVTDDIVDTCSVELSVTITTCSASVSVSSQTDATCFGGSDGSVTVSATGLGTSPVYEWSSGGTNATESGLAAGSYDISVTGDGCSASTSVTIGEASEITYSVTSSYATCGSANGDLSFSASGGDGGPYEYSIDNGASFQTSGIFANLSSGDYSVMIRDNSSCEISATESVLNLDGASIDNEVVSNVTTCGGSDGSIEITVSGGSGTYEFSIDGGSTFTSGTSPYTADNLAAGTYSIQVDDGSCVTTGSILTIFDPTAPDAPTASADVSYCNGDVLNDLSVSGTGGTYTWYEDAALSSALGTGSTFSPSNTLGSTAYYVTETVSNCESSADSAIVTINALPTVSSSATKTTVCEGESVTLTGSGAASYTWDNSVTDSEAFFPTTTTTYTVTGTDSNGCTGNDAVTVTVNSAPVVVANATATTVCEGESVTLTGSGATSYSWDNGVTDGEAFIPAATTTYTVTGTDNIGCTGTDEITVTVKSPAIAANATATSLCAGESVTLSGSGATSYSWDNGVTDGEAFIPASTQTYTVTGTDSNGCTGTDKITVTVNSTPAVVASATATTICEGESVTLTGSGANSYTWDNSVTDNEAFFPTTTTTYTVSGTDSNGCTGNDAVTVTVNSAPVVVANATATTVCEGESVTLTGSGATSYSWDNGVADGEAFIPAATATYTVTGTGDNGCTGSDQITVTVEIIEVSVELSGQTLSASIAADSYQWIDCSTNEIISGETGQSFVPGDNGSYAVEVTRNGCVATSDCFDFSITGIDDDLSSEGLQMYPNPVLEVLNVDFDEIQEHVSIEVLNMAGNVLIRKGFELESTISVDLKGLLSGVYLVHIHSDNEDKMVKIIKH